MGPSTPRSGEAAIAPQGRRMAAGRVVSRSRPAGPRRGPGPRPSALGCARWATAPGPGLYCLRTRRATVALWISDTPSEKPVMKWTRYILPELQLVRYPESAVDLDGAPHDVVDELGGHVP